MRVGFYLRLVNITGDVFRLCLLCKNNRNAEGLRHDTGNSDTGSLNRQDLIDLFTLKAAAELFSDICGSVIPYKNEAGIDIIPSEVADVDLVRCSFESMEASLNVASNVSKVENEYDYVIFDCPPSLGTAVAGPLLASDRLIVPVVLGGNFQESIRSIRAAVDAIRSSTPKLKLLGYVVNNLPRNSPLDEKLFENVKDWLGEDVFPTCIHNRLTTLRAGQLKKPVFGFLNKKASRELTEFFDSIMDRLGESRLGLPEITKEEK